MSKIEYFLDSGRNANEIASKLSPSEVLKNYDLLVSHGATIDIFGLMRSLDSDFVDDHWEDFVRHGIDVDTVTRYCRETISDDIEIYLLEERGVSPNLLMNLSQRMLLHDVDWPARIITHFLALKECGLPVVVIKRWIDGHLGNEMLCDIIENPKDWAKIGIDAEDFIDAWLEEFGCEYVNGYYLLSALPKTVSIERLIDFVPIKEFLDSEDFVGFIKEFLKIGADIEILARKFINEIGYIERSARAMLDLIAFGGATSIDLRRVVESIDVRNLDRLDKDDYLLDLYRIGAPEELISKFNI